MHHPPVNEGHAAVDGSHESKEEHLQQRARSASDLLGCADVGHRMERSIASTITWSCKQVHATGQHWHPPDANMWPSQCVSNAT
jgi:hypothetical protein